jgi:cytochrome P450
MESAEGNLNQAGGCPVGNHGSPALAGASLLDPAIHNDRFPFYQRLRKEAPVHFDPRLGMYLVSRYEDIRAILRDSTTFSMERGYVEQYAKGYKEEWVQILERDGGGFFRDGIMTDPPVHTRVRKLLERAFTAHRVKGLEPRIRAIVVDELQRVAQQGQADGRIGVAAPITAKIICEELGFNPETVGVSTIERWATCVSAQIGRMQSREKMLENAKSMCELQHFIIEHLQQRRSEPREDIISDLVHARVDDEANPTLTLEELVSSTRALLSAGTDATSTGILNILFILSTEPELARQLRDNADDELFMTRFVEELLRREPPTHGLARMTTRATEVGGVPVPEGAHLLLMYASANYDEKEFACPRNFDVSRSNMSNHLSFGGGIHRCIGASLARMELKVFAQEAVRLLGTIRLAVPVEELTYVPSIATHTLLRLPLTFSH